MLKKVLTKNGWVRGIAAADPRIISYKGIPFAKPPVGELRWRPPQPCGDWAGVRDCLEYASISMQSIPGTDADNIYTHEWNVDPTIPMNEDCLYLNVWTPARTADEKLPVFVWYFGGALQWGNCQEMEFDAERIARRGIVVVTVNYRLNVFGFLAHPLLREEDPATPYNFGNLDQQLALKWTYENILAFGGNPENITIGGQSAGGGSVMTQLNCPENAKYIKGAVVLSGMFKDPYKRTYEITAEEARVQSEEFFAYLGVKSLEEARALPAEYIRDKNDAFGKMWATIADGFYQKNVWWESLENGPVTGKLVETENHLLDVPMLLGYTDHEFFTHPLNREEEVFSSIELGVHFFCRRGRERGYQSPRYVYEFGADIPGADHPGAFHSSDLWFFFETLAKCSRPFVGHHYDLARKMCNYLAEFIRKKDPNGADADGTVMEQWKVYVEEKQNEASADSTEGGIMYFRDRPKFQKKKFGDSLLREMERMLMV